ncbi:hypothetical protein D3C72_185700 [compost metagenome]
MSSSEVMRSIFVNRVAFDNPLGMNKEVYEYFKGVGWDFNGAELAPDGTPLVIYFDKVLKFMGGEVSRPEDFAQTYSDWTPQVSYIVAKHMIDGHLVLQFVWEQERVVFHVLSPGRAEIVEPEELFNKYISVFLS